MNAERTTPERRVKKRYSAEDRERLIEGYKASDQTKKAFCAERGVNLGTFHGWFKRAKQKRKEVKSSKPAFREVELPVPAPCPVEIILPGGARICLSNTGTPEELIKLIRGVAGC